MRQKNQKQFLGGRSHMVAMIKAGGRSLQMMQELKGLRSIQGLDILHISMVWKTRVRYTITVGHHLVQEIAISHHSKEIRHVLWTAGHNLHLTAKVNYSARVDTVIITEFCSHRHTTHNQIPLHNLHQVIDLCICQATRHCLPKGVSLGLLKERLSSHPQKLRTHPVWGVKHILEAVLSLVKDLSYLLRNIEQSQLTGT